MKQLWISEESDAKLDEATSDLSLITSAQFLEDVAYARALRHWQTVTLGIK